MGVTGKLRELYWRRRGHYDRPLPDVFLDPLRGARVLEIGGPSAVFGTGGLLPVYDVAASVDGVQWSGDTVWHEGQQDAGAYAHDGRDLGRMRIIDGVDLAGIPDGAYDAVISSHVIEHLANPLKALTAWRRVSGDGVVLLVAPHAAGTFDHRRPVTTMEHLVADFDADTSEEDLTHLEETLALHDRRRDAEGADFEAWAAKRRENAQWRVLHHHVFSTRSLLEVLDHTGVQLIAAETRFPHDIYAVGRFGPDPDNTAILGRDAAIYRSSPFWRDRR